LKVIDNKIDNPSVFIFPAPPNEKGFAENDVDGFVAVYGARIFKVFSVSPKIRLHSDR
jgi:hypothetical protein